MDTTNDDKSERVPAAKSPDDWMAKLILLVPPAARVEGIGKVTIDERLIPGLLECLDDRGVDGE